MKRWLTSLIGMMMFAVLGLGMAAGQTQSRPGTVVVPPSNVELPENIGRSVHTNFLIFVPAQKGAKPFFAGTSPGGETPQSLSCLYQTWAGQLTGCPINPPSGFSYNTPSGGSKVIAIVDAYDYPTACNDFNYFSTQFGLRKANCNDPNDPTFHVVYAAGSQPRSNCGWAQEAALDIEWAHAMAPDAQIILVEAASNSNSDLLYSVSKASDLVASAGGGQVSMSWGSSEFSSESTNDSYFSAPGVTYFASSGDSGGKVIWPSASANVISAGGTSVKRDSNNGHFLSEAAWSSAGAGPSKYVPWPGYQSGISTLASILNGARGTPDISFDADPYTGVSVYDSTSCQGMSGWLVFGGTSVSSPSLAGIFNLAGAFGGGWDNGTNPSDVQSNLYGSYNSTSSGGTGPYSDYFYDVTSGSAGSYPAGNDWDLATGIGTIRGVAGLAGSSSSSKSFSLSASPSSLSVTAGSSTGGSVTVTPSGGYTGSVSLGYSAPLGSGIAVTFVTNTVVISGTNAVSSALTVKVGGSATPGTYTVTITGTDASVTPNLTSSTTLSVTVTSASSGGDFTISASPSSLTISPKGSTSYTITVGSVSGFSGSVTLSVSESIPQSRGTVSPDPVTVTSGGSATSTLTVSTGPKTAPGLYTISIIGTSGSLTHSTSVSLTVQ